MNFLLPSFLPLPPGKIVVVILSLYLIKYFFMNKINLKLVYLFILALPLFKNPFMVL